MKKKYLVLFIVIGALFFMAQPVLAENITACDASIKGAAIDEKIPNTVSTIITIIKIVVPILLVVFGMMDLVKGIISQKEDEIKKGQQIFIKRLIAGALVFFVFIIVQLIISLVADGQNENKNIMTCVNCFINNKGCKGN